MRIVGLSDAKGRRRALGVLRLKRLPPTVSAFMPPVQAAHREKVLVLPGAVRTSVSTVSMAQQLKPVMWYPPARPGDRLLLGAAGGWRQLRAVVIVVGLVVPEPVLAGLERPDYRMPGVLPVLGRMTRQRVVAATDVPASRTTPQVHPPTTDLIALDAAHTARRH